MSFIRVTTTSTSQIANGGVTGGSATSEVCCQAAVNACRELNQRYDFISNFRTRSTCSASTVYMILCDTFLLFFRLLPYKKANPKASWTELLNSLDYSVNLNVNGWFSPDQNPNQDWFQYFVWAACVTEVELDVLSGNVHVMSSEILYDCGKSLNPAIDVGQIEGIMTLPLTLYYY